MAVDRCLDIFSEMADCWTVSMVLVMVPARRFLLREGDGGLFASEIIGCGIDVEICGADVTVVCADC